MTYIQITILIVKVSYCSFHQHHALNITYFICKSKIYRSINSTISPITFILAPGAFQKNIQNNIQILFLKVMTSLTYHQILSPFEFDLHQVTLVSFCDHDLVCHDHYENDPDASVCGKFKQVIWNSDTYNP